MQNAECRTKKYAGLLRSALYVQAAFFSSLLLVAEVCLDEGEGDHHHQDGPRERDHYRIDTPMEVAPFQLISWFA
jgi:hypothetical protein